jgi:hypothetical protein
MYINRLFIVRNTPHYCINQLSKITFGCQYKSGKRQGTEDIENECRHVSPAFNLSSIINSI